MPRLGLRISLRTTPLQTYRKCQQSMSPPLGHRVDKLTSISFRIPTLVIRIGPEVNRFRVQVVENSLHHATVKQEAFNLMALPDSAFIRGPAIDLKGRSHNRDFRFARG